MTLLIEDYALVGNNATAAYIATFMMKSAVSASAAT
jgi:hypothetical protein